MSTTPFPVRVWRGSVAARAFFAATVVLNSFAVYAADALFPQPLHLTRRIEDPVSQQTSTVQEYCAGNRVITVSGDRVVIADYAKQELTEIDRAAGTYSVTSFADLAKATPLDPMRNVTAVADAKSAAPEPRWKSTPLGVKSSAAGRSVDAYEIRFDRAGGDTVKIEIGVDRNVRLSREAAAVLLGASFPNPHHDEHDAILDAARSAPVKTGNRLVTTNAANTADYGLPVEQVTSFEAGAARLVLKNTIVDVRNELPPADLLIIPPGATRVESHAVRLARELRELDELPSQKKSH